MLESVQQCFKNHSITAIYNHFNIITLMEKIGTISIS